MEIRLYDNRIPRGAPGYGANIGKSVRVTLTGPPSKPRLSVETNLAYEIFIELDGVDADVIRSKLNALDDAEKRAKEKRALKKQ